MRLAMVVTGGLHPGGREQVVPSLLALFSRLARRHEVHAFALRHLPRATTYNLRGFIVHDLGRPSAPLGLGRWAQARALRRALKAAGPFDLVHGFWGDPAGLLAARAGRRFGIPAVVTCDSGEFVSRPEIDYGSQRSARGRSAIAEACRLASYVHVCTTYMKDLAGQHGVPAAVIPIGTTTPGSIVEGEQTRNEPGVFAPRTKSEPGILRILQVASLSRVKNQRLAIDAVAILAKSLRVHLDLIGEDTLGGELQAHAVTLGLANRITFHGFVPHAELPSHFTRADVYLQTSLHEAAGVSVLEAASFGVPVVGTRVGYIADWAPGSAAAVDGRTPGAFAAAIESGARDAVGQQMRAASAHRWATTHDADWTAAQVESMYGGLCGARIRPPA